MQKIKEILTKIADKENGEYGGTEEFYSSGNGVRMSVNKYALRFNYRGVSIELLCDFGQYNSCVVYGKYPNEIDDFDFNISTKSHFLRLFSRNKKPFRVRTTNDFLKGFIWQNRPFELLTKIATNAQFEPEITGNSKNGSYQIEIRYSLAFEDKLTSIEPVIELQKSFVEYFILNREITGSTAHT